MRHSDGTLSVVRAHMAGRQRGMRTVGPVATPLMHRCAGTPIEWNAKTQRRKVEGQGLLASLRPGDFALDASVFAQADHCGRTASRRGKAAWPVPPRPAARIWLPRARMLWLSGPVVGRWRFVQQARSVNRGRFHVQARSAKPGRIAAQGRCRQSLKPACTTPWACDFRRHR